MSKKSKIIGLVLGAAILLALAGWYLGHANIPVLEPRGPVGIQERRLIIITILLSLIVVVPVFSLLIVFAWKYRETNPNATYSPELDHSRIAETVWWLIPSAIIFIIGIMIWNSSHYLDPYKRLSAASPPLNIQVVALDWKWLFIYPDQHIASVNYLQFPRQTPLNFDITSDSVMNSFWIPQLGGQIYAMPGMSTQLHLLAASDGSFHGSSANISGNGFAGMAFTARASSYGAFQQWVNQVRRSSQSLNADAYQRLASPSKYNGVSYYSQNTSNLYNGIIGKYLAPVGSTAAMPGMVMR